MPSALKNSICMLHLNMYKDNPTSAILSHLQARSQKNICTLFVHSAGSVGDWAYFVWFVGGMGGDAGEATLAVQLIFRQRLCRSKHLVLRWCGSIEDLCAELYLVFRWFSSCWDSKQRKYSPAQYARFYGAKLRRDRTKLHILLQGTFGGFWECLRVKIGNDG